MLCTQSAHSPSHMELCSLREKEMETQEENPPGSFLCTGWRNWEDQAEELQKDLGSGCTLQCSNIERQPS